MMNNFPIKKPKNATDAAIEAISIEPSSTDPLGMYTGKPIDENENPVQDGDDL